MGALDHSSLEHQCHHFLVQGLASSTRSTYLSGQNKFYDFCLQLGKIHQSGSPCLTDKWTLCLFATFLANTVQHSTIKVYLSAVRSLHIEQGFADPLVDCLRLQQVPKGIKITQGDTSLLRLPVTDDMMVIFRSLDLSLPDHCIFWAACNLAYFSFLCSAEFTVPDLASFSPSIHLGFTDVAVDSMSSPPCLRLRIKASKTDPFWKGWLLLTGLSWIPYASGCLQLGFGCQVICVLLLLSDSSHCDFILDPPIPLVLVSMY